ncbi:phosphoribosyl-ATP pyrophosphohydrolase [Paludibacterium paludis]|uniref:Phosphoribosyl-ATP pyrophosphohydrolase n=1 Tax=Paludibacterium paludis TaxID=1225769 RepID=A0A918P0H6_9NEIS|nr:phosphoribosyl-ATP pyrophosphohydrolase [Paludibacterium paludis]GGY10596.1 hypothetical protein GCM10011289_11700 [Paludibacterium paludis]
MSDFFALRRDFMRRFDMPVPAQPGHRETTLAMWETMVGEEWREFTDALAAFKDMAASGDEATRVEAMAELTAEGVDLLNVLTGLLLSQGMPVEAMTQAIHEANLRKCQDGKVVKRADGKILKPPGWEPADKLAVIAHALRSPLTPFSETTDTSCGAPPERG